MSRFQHYPNVTALPEGGLPEYIWPGGYPAVYVDSTNETCCAACAERLMRDAEDDGGSPIGVTGFIHWEGPPEHCTDCGKTIDSAYGVPDGDQR